MTPTLKLRVGGSRNDVQITALIDTGFDGFVCLPTDIAVTLGLELFTTAEIELADGSIKKNLVFLGTATFLRETTPVLIYLTDSADALIGTELLADCVMTIDFGRNKVEVRRKKRRSSNVDN